jgi:uridine phosphorylase
MSEQKIGWVEATGPAVADDVVLEASVLRRPVHGRDRVLAVMGAANTYYARLDVVREAAAGPRTYLEWEATGPDGTEMAGVTVLTRDDDGQLVHVAIHHRPLDAALAFSREIGRRTAGQVPPGYFDEPPAGP